MRLLIIPVVYSEAEIGSLRNDISKIIEVAFGKDSRERHKKEVYIFWKKLKEFLERILNDVNMEKVKLYQDGIPIGGELGVKIVEEGTKNGRQNFQIVYPLVKKVLFWRRQKTLICLY